MSKLTIFVGILGTLPLRAIAPTFNEHLLAEPLVAALARRTACPFATVDDGATRCGSPARSPGSASTTLPRAPADRRRPRTRLRRPVGRARHRAPRRRGRCTARRLRRVDEGAAGRVGRLGPLPLSDPDPRRVDALLDEGFAGLCLPAGALAQPAASIASARRSSGSPAAARRSSCTRVRPAGRRGRARVVAGGDRLRRLAPGLLVRLDARGRYEHPRCASCSPRWPGSRRSRPSGSSPAAARIPARRPPLLRHLVLRAGRDAVDARGGRCRQLVYGSDRPVVEPSRPTRTTWSSPTRSGCSGGARR